MNRGDIETPKYWPFLAVFAGLTIILALELLIRLFTT